MAAQEYYLIPSKAMYKTKPNQMPVKHQVCSKTTSYE